MRLKQEENLEIEFGKNRTTVNNYLQTSETTPNYSGGYQRSKTMSMGDIAEALIMLEDIDKNSFAIFQQRRFYRGIKASEGWGFGSKHWTKARMDVKTPHELDPVKKVWDSINFSKN